MILFQSKSDSTSKKRFRLHEQGLCKAILSYRTLPRWNRSWISHTRGKINPEPKPIGKWPVDGLLFVICNSICLNMHEREPDIVRRYSGKN